MWVVVSLPNCIPKRKSLMACSAAIFDAIDTDRSGTIEDHELLTHLLQKGQPPDKIETLFRGLDVNSHATFLETSGTVASSCTAGR